MTTRIILFAALILACLAAPVLGADALAEVNAAREARGLRPFIRDDGLVAAAEAAARFRAERLLAGHSQNDFAFLPAGCTASAAGCGAMDSSWGFQACAMYENHTHAGAASVRGRDGKIYHHLFVRNGGAAECASGTCSTGSCSASVTVTTTTRTSVTVDVEGDNGGLLSRLRDRIAHRHRLLGGGRCGR